MVQTLLQKQILLFDVTKCTFEISIWWAVLFSSATGAQDAKRGIPPLRIYGAQAQQERCSANAAEGLSSHTYLWFLCVWRALESFTRARSFKCFTCFANNSEKWSNCIHLVWDEQKKCSLCTTEILPVHVFSQRCSTLPFFMEDCLLWKYLFYFPLSENFPSCMKSPVEGETHYSASLHFCAFGLLECIVNNQRNKGTWVEEERGAEVQRVSWQCTWQLWPFHSLHIPLGLPAPRGCCSSAGGGPGLGAGSAPAASTWGVWIVYASIKDLWKWNWVLLQTAWDFISRSFPANWVIWTWDNVLFDIDHILFHRNWVTWSKTKHLGLDKNFEE